MNAYEAKQESRRERLERAIERAESASRAAYDRAMSATAMIPFGQPILVGHHSESRHRNALKRQDGAMRRASELSKLADKLRGQLAGIGNAGISSDDPDAVPKLADKRTELEARRDAMKAANAYYRKHKTLDGWDGPADLADDGRVTLRVQAYYGVPFPPYALQNIGARIRQAAKRAEHIETVAAMPANVETVGLATITTDPDENRVLLAFPSRLTKDDYKRVRSYGFVWSPSRNAFVRKLSTTAVWNARSVAATITTTEG